MSYRSRAKRGPTDQGMKLAKMVAKFSPAGRRMKFEEKLAWRRRQLEDALARYGLSWHERYENVLLDQALREDRRSDHARYVRAYGSGRDRSRIEGGKRARFYIRSSRHGYSAVLLNSRGRSVNVINGGPADSESSVRASARRHWPHAKESRS
jgi:hypothetical protein